MSRNLAHRTGEAGAHPFDTHISGLLPADAERLRDANVVHYCLGCRTYKHKQYKCTEFPLCRTCGKEGHLERACTTAGITDDRRPAPATPARVALPVRPSPIANDQETTTTPRRPRGPPRIPSSSPSAPPAPESPVAALPEVPRSSPEVSLAVEALDARESALVNEREAFEGEKRVFAAVKAAFEVETREFAERVKEVEGREAAIEARELEKELGVLEEKKAALEARLKERKRKAGEALEEEQGDGGKE